MQPRTPLKIGVAFCCLGIIFIIVSFMPLYAFLPETSYWEARPGVASGYSVSQDLGFLYGKSYVRILVWVWGGNNVISAEVRDSSMNNLTQKVNVREYWSFFLEVPKNDYYSLYLSNTYTYYSTGYKNTLIQVYYYFYNIIFQILGILILVLGLVFVSYYILKRKIQTSPETVQRKLDEQL